ncbi:hypothetical protein AKJ09_01583 [Labilithrix luteola]|uniref:Zinc-finger domain-containing protein n=1 Tax=Labilithrix luteola TaxID=1391654 RepID=A0A0K1PP71_9BACT|nr:zf-HC2 domain-containing protein [Labilithrix luteola]AKU94919.1 hypothetical protein AKJ09_01583 [Labilithrix luteola]
MSSPTCAFLPRVDAHFEMSISPSEEHELRDHLEGCSACRTRYEKQLLLASLDANAPPPHARLGRALGFAVEDAVASQAPVESTKDQGAPRSLRLVRRLAPLSVITAVAAAFVLYVRGSSEQGFTARGRGDTIASSRGIETAGILHVYRAPSAAPAGSQGTLVPVVDAVRANESLAFGIVNADDASHVMIFGVDESSRVYWFYPEWTNPAETPSAVPITKDRALHTMPDAITHPYAGRELHVHALFLNHAATVKEVEARLVSPARPLALADGHDYVLSFEVTR